MRACALSVFLTLSAVLGLGSFASAGDGASPKEKELIAVLRSDAPEADKALACKRLAIHGSADAVPDLAKLLGHARLASWARIPLEAIPDAACDRVLREAAGGLQGTLLIGVINSLGVRRDAQAVGLLAKRLGDGDAAVASAAAIALGLVGDEAAVAALRPALAAGPPAVRDAAAERLLAAGRGGDAAALCDAVRRADVPPQRIAEATRGAILARGPAGVPLLGEQLRAADGGSSASASRWPASSGDPKSMPRWWPRSDRRCRPALR